MPTEVWRPGDYRLCPACGARHKVQDLRCTKCNAVLAGTPVRHGSLAPATVSGARSSGSLRAVLAVGLLVAVGAGLWIRTLFRGANLQESVQASGTAPSTVPEAIPDQAPSWAPPVLQYPPIVGYNRGGVPPSMAALAMQASPVPSAEGPSAPAGMTSIAPPSEPTRKTAFTNEDLERGRSAATVTAAGATVPAVRPSAVAGDEARDWISQVRDRGNDVQKAQAQVRRLETEVELERAQAARLTGDAEAQEKAQKDVMSALDDLEKAEQKLADKQRGLDEAKDRAHAAGVRFEG
jgi:hypothetical protein